MTNTHHAIGCVELSVADLTTTSAFYEQAFGWQFSDYGPAHAGIRAPSGDGEVGGLSASAGPVPRGPLVFSEDLDATVEAVRAAGSRVVEGPTSSPGTAFLLHRSERHRTGSLVELLRPKTVRRHERSPSLIIRA